MQIYCSVLPLYFNLFVLTFHSLETFCTLFLLLFGTDFFALEWCWYLGFGSDFRTCAQLVEGRCLAAIWWWMPLASIPEVFVCKAWWLMLSSVVWFPVFGSQLCTAFVLATGVANDTKVVLWTLWSWISFWTSSISLFICCLWTNGRVFYPPTCRLFLQPRGHVSCCYAAWYDCF